MAHVPFKTLGPKHVLQPRDIVLADDTKITVDESNNMMFNIMRVMVFKPVPLRRFVQQAMVPMGDKMKELSRDGIEHYHISFELVELSVSTSNVCVPIISRFAKLKHLQQFVAANKLHELPPQLYGVRLVLVHYVPDCFVHKVVGFNRDKDTGIVSGRVDVMPVSQFACGKYASRLVGSANLTGTQNILLQVPRRVKSRCPSSIWRLDGDAVLYWLPTMQAIKPAEIPPLMKRAYFFHLPTDLKFAPIKDN